MSYVVDNWIATQLTKQKLETKQQCDCSGKESRPLFAFFGGEPTLMWDEIMMPATLWARQELDKKLEPFNTTIDISVTTNGQHFTEKRLQEWHKLGCGVLLSADGIQCVQDIDRPSVDGSSSFEKIVRIAPTLLELYPKTTFRSTVTPYSAQYLFDSFIFIYSLGFQSYFVCPNVRESWDEESRQILAKNLEGICDIHYCDISFQQDGLRFWNWFDHFTYVMDKDHFIPMSTERCGLGTTSCGIGTKGEIFGCQEHNTYDENNPFYLGNIYTGGIEQSKRDALLKKYSSLTAPVNHEYPEKCSTCPVKNCCNLLFCPSANLETTQALNRVADMDCYWKTLLYQNAERILKKTEEDNNHIFLDFLIQNNFI
jgi:radical SAM protein with 4Fe4S-binding SPASM domain